MQLWAMLESFYAHCAPHDSLAVTVTCKWDDDRYKKQYDQVKEAFPSVEFIGQDYRKDVLCHVDKPNIKHVTFVVDDCVFIAPFDFDDIIESLDSNERALGFSLRYGTTINYNYNKMVAHGQPPFLATDKPDIVKYNWPTALTTFNYPLEISSSVYRKDQILGLMQFCDIENPNTFEAELAALRMVAAKRYPQLLCYEKPRAFCLTANRVQSVFKNPAGEVFGDTPEQLAGLFERGKKIDVSKFDGFVPNSCHCEKELEFIER